MNPPAAGGPPRVVVAAPNSGAGKTTVAMGLIAALRSRGLAVSAHKVGPDYIDPGYLGLAAGRPARNLDAWLTSDGLIPGLFLHGAAGAQISVVEGVMGLFDGVAGGFGGCPDYASTAHVARLLQAPVLLVVDATAQSRSVAALVHGFATFDPRVRIGGVVLNRVGSARHERLLREALAGIGVPVLGVLHREDRVAVPSRHLGLVPVAERSAEATAAVAAAGELVARCVDLSAVAALAAGAPRMSSGPWDPNLAVGPTPHGHPGRRPRIAVAGGAAFSFSYAEHTELLRAAGAEVVTVDPCRDEALPAGTAGLVLGGGFPEVYSAALSENEMLRKDVADLAASGGVVVAECAGLLYLTRSLDRAPMCGVLTAQAAMTRRLTLGYRQAVAATDSVLGPAGMHLRGHEFHRTVTTPAAGRCPAWRLSATDVAGGTGELLDEGHVVGNVHASYLHLHWAGRPRIARRIVAAAGRAR
ncbi:MAG TPA: cobyrinate a,c-diamide synthase [Sporichthyaceae bacterium]|nr:cobyrinate a,c-diamide synthase [Sporichthyaceae bacterium]